MLKNLSVKNVALISSAEIEFDSGLNVLTGETGAGKSILVDSIGLLLGDRVDKTLIRSGETECKVTGCFEVERKVEQPVSDFCKKYDMDYSEEFYITRTFSIEGKSQIKINGQPSTLSMLKEFSSIMVDSYGQHESYSIFNPANHLTILDDYCGIRLLPEYDSYRLNYDKLKQINNSINKIGGNEEERLRNIELLNYQIEEIKNAKISKEEYEQLESDKKRLLNIGKIVTNTTDAYSFLNENTVESIAKAKNSLVQASNYDEELTSLSDRLQSVKIELNDILASIETYNENSNYSEDEQQRVDERISLYNSFFRKYGKTVDDVLEYCEKIIKERDELLNARETLVKLQNKKSIVLCDLFNLSKKLHHIREVKSEELCKSVMENLSNLNMQNAKLRFDFKPLIESEEFLCQNGMDCGEILFSANLGEPEKSLSKIASGGEISRFMLALKSVIAKMDNMPTMIFDEIDTGISGKTSEAVAKQMATIAKEHQVIAITHSQQIASMADSNYLVHKDEQNGKTYTYISKLNYDEKVKEIARFISGDVLTETAILSAKEMVEKQDKYKANIK